MNSTLAAFLARTRPVSTMPKPACMKKTRIAARSTHNVSRASTVGAGSWAAVGVSELDTFAASMPRVA
ncbi:MAG: hypothetical protein ACYTGK_13670, partial [Planctomycetota bacterium]